MEDFPARPLGVFETRLDGKGRLRLPAAFLHSLGDLRAFFVTAIDNDALRLYPRAESNQLGDAPRDAEAEVDAGGRILFPSDLRDELGLAAAPVFLQFNRDHIAVIPETVYKARRQLASASLREAVEKLRKTGLR